MKTLGTVTGGIVSSNSFRVSDSIPNVTRMSDAAIATGNANLVSELEKRDQLVRNPLTSLTYHRDIPIKVGGGWVDTISVLSSDYAVSGGSGASLASSSGSNTSRIIQANFDKESFSAHIFDIALRIGFVDMQRSKVTGRSLDALLLDGIRLAYDKHMEENVYIGVLGTTGILNNPAVVASGASTGTGGGTTFASKTADEILQDINTLIIETWNQAENDLSAMPNHIIMPYSQYNDLATRKVSPIAEKTILTFIEENNIASKNGGSLVIAATSYCKGAGVGGSDRMACYVHNDKYIAVEELVPLYRSMTAPNIEAKSFDSLYMANLSQVEFFYNQTMRYLDGI